MNGKSSCKSYITYLLSAGEWLTSHNHLHAGFSLYHLQSESHVVNSEYHSCETCLFYMTRVHIVITCNLFSQHVFMAGVSSSSLHFIIGVPSLTISCYHCLYSTTTPHHFTNMVTFSLAHLYYHCTRMASEW